jgi:hypothetical protein
MDELRALVGKWRKGEIKDCYFCREIGMPCSQHDAMRKCADELESLLHSAEPASTVGEQWLPGSAIKCWWCAHERERTEPVSEPNIFATEGDEVMVRAVVIDAHWADKRLYKVRLTKVNRRGLMEQEDMELWVHDKNLRLPEQA